MVLKLILFWAAGCAATMLNIALLIRYNIIKTPDPVGDFKFLAKLSVAIWPLIFLVILFRLVRDSLGIKPKPKAKPTHFRHILHDEPKLPSRIGFRLPTDEDF